MTGTVVIIGCGNLLMGDDGVGVHAIRRLQARPLPPHVQTVEGGVAVWAVLAAARRAAQLLLIDAVYGGGPPGNIYRLTPADLTLPAARALSLHQFSLAEALLLAWWQGGLPTTVIFGVEPAAVAPGLTLSPPVVASLPRLEALVLAEAGVGRDA